MRLSVLSLTCMLLAAAASGSSTSYAQDKPAAGAGEASNKVITGIVQQVDEEEGHIVIDGQTYVMARGSEGLIPNVGQKVTFVYENRNGENVVLTFRQPSK